MPDDLTRQLERLAPRVDVAASETLFERSRSGGRNVGRGWLAAAACLLVVGGVVGIWAIARNGDESLPAVTDADTGHTVRPIEPGSEFEVLLATETTAAFGQVDAATDQELYEHVWETFDPGVEAPAIDFGRHIALVMTRPDNACADTLTRFEVDGVVWRPVFEELSSACDDPLLSWVYVVAVDRSALGEQIVIDMPADDVYDIDAVRITVDVGAGEPAADRSAVPVELTPTGVTVPLPPVGEPQLAITQVGVFWLNAHDDGTVSVLDAIVDVTGEEDEGGVTGLARLVAANEDGTVFGGIGIEWDAHGRAINGGRTRDLVGWAGVVSGEEVEIARSTATRVPGDPERPSAPSAFRAFEVPTDLLTLDVLPTLSFSGPIWRQLDATMVVAGGVGRLCEIDVSAPVPDVTICEHSWPTTITASNPDITSWYFGPLLAEFDQFGTITRFVPQGGQSSRNDGDLDVSAQATSGSQPSSTAA